jgi:hypothetical protein
MDNWQSVDLCLPIDYCLLTICEVTGGYFTNHEAFIRI